jgi:hypothetical protein
VNSTFSCRSTRAAGVTGNFSFAMHPIIKKGTSQSKPTPYAASIILIREVSLIFPHYFN